MAARLIKKEDVAKACGELVAAGEQPTTVKIHKMLGKGSFSTIQKFILAWKESDSAKDAQADQLPAVIQLPAEFKEASELLLKKIFKLAEKEQESKVTQIKLDCDQVIDTAKKEVEESVNYAEGIGEENDDLKDKLVEATNNITSLDEEVGNLKGRLSDSERNTATLEVDAKEANAEITRLLDLLAKSETNVALLKQETEQSKSALIKSEATHTKVVSDLKLEFGTEIQSLKDSSLEAVKAEKDAHAIVIKGIKDDNTAATKALTAANNKIVSVAEKSVLDAQKQRDEANKKIATLEDKLAMKPANTTK